MRDSSASPPSRQHGMSILPVTVWLPAYCSCLNFIGHSWFIPGLQLVLGHSREEGQKHQARLTQPGDLTGWYLAGWKQKAGSWPQMAGRD